MEVRVKDSTKTLAVWIKLVKNQGRRNGFEVLLENLSCSTENSPLTFVCALQGPFTPVTTLPGGNATIAILQTPDKNS